MFQAIVRLLEWERQRLNLNAIDWRGWVVEAMEGTHEEFNIEDGAILVCCYARCLLECRSCFFDINTIGEVRQQIRNEVSSSSLDDMKLGTEMVCVLHFCFISNCNKSYPTYNFGK